MTYPLIPSVFIMEVASNGGSGIVDSQPNLLKYLQVYLNGGTNPGGFAYQGVFPWANANKLFYGGDWSVVWGPCLYCRTNAKGVEARTATNAMYVAYCAALNTYLVAIAATNPTSFFDWIVEDGDVLPSMMTAWPPKLPFMPVRHDPPIPRTVPAISAGTAIGISNLLTQPQMVDPKQGDLQSFLASKVDANATLIFGGHSLAGALSPTLANYLYPQPASAGWKQVLVVPTAGATPGNYAYASGYSQTYLPQRDPSSSFVFNVDYANNHDVVPHAWDKLAQVVQPKDADGNYPSIWGVLQGPGRNTVGGFVYLAVIAARLLAGGYYHAITQQWVTPSFGYWDWGTSYPPSWEPLPDYTDAMPMSTTEQLGQMIGATHVDQYYNYFGVVPPPLMQKPPLERSPLPTFGAPA